MSDYLLGIHEYVARTSDEIDVRKGDYIEVIEDDAQYQDQWYIGRNLATGRTGLFPKIYTTSVAGKPPNLEEKPVKTVNTRGSSPQHNLEESPVSVASLSQASASRHSESTESTEINGSSKTYTRDGAPTQSRPYIPERSASVAATMNDIDAALNEMHIAPPTPQSSSTTTVDAPDPTSVVAWSPADVKTYLIARGHDPSAANSFLVHNVTGQILLELGRDDLKELDIPSFGTRYEIHKEITYLNAVAQGAIGLGFPPFSPTSGSIKSPTIPQVAQPQQTVPTAKYTFPTFAPSPTATTTSSFDSTPARTVFPPSSVPSGGQQLSRLSSKPHNSNGAGDQHGSIFDGLEACEPADAPSRQGNQKDGHSRSDSRSSMIAAAASSAWHAKSPPASPHPTSPKQYRRSHSRSVSEVSRPSLRAGDAKAHRRHSSVFSFVSNNFNASPVKHKKTPSQSQEAEAANARPQAPLTKEEIVREKERELKNQGNKDVKRTNTTFKDLRSASTQVLKPHKIKTSAFQEGIQNVSAHESGSDAQCSGWMRKRGGTGPGVWRTRYFTLHGTRLSYFSSFKDTKEKGLIDIIGHRVIRVWDSSSSEDRLVALYAASVGAGRNVFKLVPPAPGYKKGVAFTAPKTHYFAVETEEELEKWVSALTVATIERDDSSPVISTCRTETVSLAKARELMAERLKREAASQRALENGEEI